MDRPILKVSYGPTLTGKKISAN